MDSKSGKPLRVLVNPFAIWTDFALKSGQAILASTHAAVARANAPKVAVIPTEDSAPQPAMRAMAKRRKAVSSKPKRKKRRAKR